MGVGSIRLPRVWNGSTGKKCSSNGVASRPSLGAFTEWSWVGVWCPTSVLTKIPPHLFKVVLLRRLRLPLPLSPHTCGCGLPIDSFGHHRASCTRTGALGRRGFALESAAARVCREAGGRVTTNVMVRDLDLPVLNATDSRPWEVVVDGLPLFGGSQLAVDTTLVCSSLRRFTSQWVCGHRRRDLPWGQAAQRAEMPRVGGTWQSRAPGRVGFGCGWQVVGGVVHFHLPVGEGKGST